MQNNKESECLNDSSIKESKDSNKIIFELVGQENDVASVTNVKESEDDLQKIPLSKENRGLKLLKRGLSK